MYTREKMSSIRPLLLFLYGGLLLIGVGEVAAADAVRSAVKAAPGGQPAAVGGSDPVVWRDPFQYSGPAVSVSKAPGGTTQKTAPAVNPRPQELVESRVRPVSTPLVLKGIIESDTGRLALVNGRSVRAGESVMGRKIRLIKRYSIVVVEASGEREIFILASGDAARLNSEQQAVPQ